MCRLSRMRSTNGEAQSSILRKQYRCERCIVPCNLGSATENAGYAPLFSRLSFDRLRHFRTSRSMAYCPNADPPKTPQPRVRSSRLEESCRLLLIWKAGVCGLSCSCFYYSTLRKLCQV